ncbi:polysaccharide deacetylase family protein [Paenibacillus thalictri]|uniref:Polysaccharide deacetylase n=1 Tax=Paenibacillus thalictri TaxID=2527873 RepID=A0A4Q9DKB8_9BACL|nr:polysaccharide deacetylase family protein [Paenibacillus thalictri]TBL71184.1 polysaccharide deacetylase [Paenibacillus thalictri]
MKVKQRRWILAGTGVMLTLLLTAAGLAGCKKPAPVPWSGQPSAESRDGKQGITADMGLKGEERGEAALPGSLDGTVRTMEEEPELGPVWISSRAPSAPQRNLEPHSLESETGDGGVSGPLAAHNGTASSAETVDEENGRSKSGDQPDSKELSGASGPKTAFLTFDDGPSGSTPAILDILKQYGVKATFFVNGSNSAEGKAMYKKIVEDGHKLGNHTFSHNYNQIYGSVEAFEDDLKKLDDLLFETVGFHTDIIRFPGGSNNHLSWKAGGRNVMKKITREMVSQGYQYFDWNVSSTDAAAPVQDRQAIIDSVMENSRGKSRIIVLMHDNTRKKTTVEALPTVIEKLSRDGYSFDVLQRDSFTFRFLQP